MVQPLMAQIAQRSTGGLLARILFISRPTLLPSFN